MARRAAWLFIVLVGCGSSAVSAERRTLPEPVVELSLPDRPPEVDPAHRWTRSVEVCTEEGGTETPPGILFSDQMAARAARLSVGYSELRALYEIDQKTWAKERAVYGRYLELGDEAIERANKRAERSWWERHQGQIGLAGGFIVGAALTTAIVAAVSKADDAGE